MGSSVELARELIALSRQGGATLQEIRDRRRAEAAEREAAVKEKEAAAAKGSRSTAGKAGMRKTQSSPALNQTVRTSASQGAGAARSTGARRGGGWATPDADELAKLREKVDQALSQGGDLNYCEGPFRRTALWEAAWKNHQAVVRLLAAKGANIAVADYQGRTPLHEAAFYGHVGMLELLLEKGHPLECADVFGQTPLLRAVEGGRHEAVRFLVEHGAYANQLDADGVTAQHIAAFRGTPVLSAFLLHSGAYKHRWTIGEPISSLQGSVGTATSVGKPRVTKTGLRTPLKAGATLVFA